jgi:hypothetical protein
MGDSRVTTLSRHSGRAWTRVCPIVPRGRPSFDHIVGDQNRQVSVGSANVRSPHGDELFLPPGGGGLSS